MFTRDMVKKVFNIPSGNQPVELFKRHEQCELRNIYHKNGKAPIAHTVNVLHRARNDDGDTMKRSWVLLALATVLTPSTGNMVPLEYLKSLEEMDKVAEFAWDEHVLSVAMREVKKCQDKIKSQATSSFWVGGCFPMLAVYLLFLLDCFYLSQHVFVCQNHILSFLCLRNYFLSFLFRLFTWTI